jgi:NADH-quinone oxidoreductase E subunit
VTADVATSPRFSEAALAEYQAILARYPTRRAALMPTLWLAQREFGYLPLPVQEYVAGLMELPLAWVASVVSFYTMYWTEPPARWHLQVCRNLSCALRGGLEIRDALTARLGIRHGERTADGRFSLEEVECLASCGTAPCLQVNNAEYHENLTVESALVLVERLAKS